MTTITHVKATTGQLKHINRLVSDVIEKVVDELCLSKAGAQRIIERGDDFVHTISEAISLGISDLSVPKRYKNEEVESHSTYPSEYNGPNPIEEQVTVLVRRLGFDPTQALKYSKNLPELPAGAEGWFAIPSNAGLKKLFPKIEDDAERYCLGVQLILEKIFASRKFSNLCYGEITPDRLRVHAHTARALDFIAKHQPGDILIVAAQLGMRHRGRSARRAREWFDSNEFGLGALAVGSIVLTHPKRLVREGDLVVDCPGDEFDSRDGDGHFVHAPIFKLRYDSVNFSGKGCARANISFGSVTAFVVK